MLVSERSIAPDLQQPGALAVPADPHPIPIARADLSRTLPAGHTPCDWDCLAARRGRRGVMYDTFLATGRLGGRRRGLARGSPPPRRAMARGSEQRSLARPGEIGRASCRERVESSVGVVS